jgi:acetyl/propionyl-CoA carboxylase alpha subunit
MIYEFVYKGESKVVELNDKKLATFGDGSEPIRIDYTPDGRLFLRQGMEVKEIFAAVDGDKTFVDIDGVLYEFTVPSGDAGATGAAGGAEADPTKVYAPMPGKIVKLMVKEGDAVEEKQHLVIVEAMKMEHIIVARARGMVKAVNFVVGAQVDTESPLIELEISDE